MSTAIEAEQFAQAWKVEQADALKGQLLEMTDDQRKMARLYLVHLRGTWGLAFGPPGMENILVEGCPPLPVELYAPVHEIPYSHLAFAICTATIKVPA